MEETTEHVNRPNPCSWSGKMKNQSVRSSELWRHKLSVSQIRPRLFSSISFPWTLQIFSNMAHCANIRYMAQKFRCYCLQLLSEMFLILWTFIEIQEQVYSPFWKYAYSFEVYISPIFLPIFDYGKAFISVLQARGGKVLKYKLISFLLECTVLNPASLFSFSFGAEFRQCFLRPDTSERCKEFATKCIPYRVAC
jgi:hypothetical protein